MSVFESLSLMIAFAILLLTLLAYIDKNDRRRR
ncbi:MAG: putative holin-like toxin [Eubacteriales bacterium]|nr:putative holin-like toxin [Eubacteriales bacterium]